MINFKFQALDIEGAYLITSFFSADKRGSLIKYFEKNVYLENKIPFNCSEAFISHSGKNVVRGMHFQTKTPQAKIVGVILGKVYDVIVDLRKKSPTFGEWRGYYLSNQNRSSLYIPSGFAHGFISLCDDSVVSYQCEGEYNKETDTGIRYDDPDIGITWPVDIGQVIISSRDKNLMSFKKFIDIFDGLN
jgi:dTDP-4-dehydrorhamnose 3,5-epimerase